MRLAAHSCTQDTVDPWKDCATDLATPKTESPSTSAGEAQNSDDIQDHSEYSPAKKPRLDLLHNHRQKEVDLQPIKKCFEDSGFFPIPDSNDAVFLETELRRCQYCKEHGWVYDTETRQAKQNGAHVTSGSIPLKRHSVLAPEDEDIPKKVRVLRRC